MNGPFIIYSEHEPLLACTTQAQEEIDDFGSSLVVRGKWQAKLKLIHQAWPYDINMGMLLKVCYQER